MNRLLILLCLTVPSVNAGSKISEIYYAEVEITKPGVVKNELLDEVRTTELREDDGLETLKKMITPVSSISVKNCVASGMIIDSQTLDDDKELGGKATLQIQADCSDGLEKFLARINQDSRLRIRGTVVRAPQPGVI